MNIIHLRELPTKINVTKRITNRICMLTFLLCIFFEIILPVNAKGISFTKEEQEFINERRILQATSIDRAAPHHYRDSKGEIKGIAVNVLKEIENISGLIFNYYLYDSIEEVFENEGDIHFGLSKEYVPPGIVLSVPYLKSETILYYNSSLDPSELEGKRYAAIRGGTLPKGIKEENTIFFNNREDTFKAVEYGKADYGYGNAYSLAFYTLQNNYKNIVTIPTGKEDREYCLGVPEENRVLLSILNKSIEAISESHIETLVLDVASKIERKITFSMIMDIYWKEIVFIIIIVLSVLLYGINLSIQANKKLKKDIIREVKEKEDLAYKSQLDGLTSLYNAISFKELTSKSIKNRHKDIVDAFILIDCNDFKAINDNFGHIKGDEVLINIGKGLKLVFRKTDLLGRIGGDEFCVYMHNIPSVDFIRLKCHKLSSIVQELSEGLNVTISVGISVVNEIGSYEKFFKQADEAMYIAKKNYEQQITVYGVD